jgi:hypothetical protein
MAGVCLSCAASALKQRGRLVFIPRNGFVALKEYHGQGSTSALAQRARPFEELQASPGILWKAVAEAQMEKAS